MIRRTAIAALERVEFTLATSVAVSVVGDFNGWDTLAGGMSTIGVGQRRAVVTLAPGRYAFRYVNEAGEYFDDPDADGFEPNGYGQFHGILIVEHASLNLDAVRGSGEPRTDVDAGHDQRIGQRFGHAVAGHPYLANAEIEYFVEDQVIHLEGFVTSRLAKQALWDLAWGVREIRDVDARIAIDCSR